MRAQRSITSVSASPHGATPPTVRSCILASYLRQRRVGISPPPKVFHFAFSYPLTPAIPCAGKIPVPLFVARDGRSAGATRQTTETPISPPYVSALRIHGSVHSQASASAGRLTMACSWHRILLLWRALRCASARILLNAVQLMLGR